MLGLLKELIKLPTRADNSQSAREVQGTGQARSMQRNTRALKELIKLPTRADNNQSAREVRGTGQAGSMQRNTKQELNL